MTKSYDNMGGDLSKYTSQGNFGISSSTPTEELRKIQKLLYSAPSTAQNYMLNNRVLSLLRGRGLNP